MTVNKTYISNSIFAATLMVKGVRVHISFYPYNHGGSYYATSNPDIQEALEAYDEFGVNYKLSSTVEEKPAVEEKKETEVEITKVPVSGIAEAKEHLAITYGYARSNLRTKSAILAAAKEHNIEFVGI